MAACCPPGPVGCGGTPVTSDGEKGRASPSALLTGCPCPLSWGCGSRSPSSVVPPRASPRFGVPRCPSLRLPAPRGRDPSTSLQVTSSCRNSGVASRPGLGESSGRSKGAFCLAGSWAVGGWRKARFVPSVPSIVRCQCPPRRLTLLDVLLRSRGAQW